LMLPSCFSERLCMGMRAESCSLDLQQKSQMPLCSSNTSFEHLSFLIEDFFILLMKEPEKYIQCH
jgi:hypothetical protein